MVKHKIRDHKEGLRTVKLTPIKAIRYFCIECMGFSVQEVKSCTSLICPLFPYRLGRRTQNKQVNVETG